MNLLQILIQELLKGIHIRLNTPKPSQLSMQQEDGTGKYSRKSAREEKRLFATR